MSLVHYSQVLSKLDTFSQQKAEVPYDALMTSSQITHHLFQNMQVLDPTSTIITLKALQNEKLNLKDSITPVVMEAIEDKVMQSFAQY